MSTVNTLTNEINSLPIIQRGGGYHYQLETEIEIDDYWIDGSKIYLWIAEFTSATAINTVQTVYFTDYFYNNNCKIIGIDGFLFLNDSGICSINYARSDGMIGTHWNNSDPSSDTKGLRQRSSSNSWTNKPGILFLKYIKLQENLN